jgi:hypothetical protein
VKHEGTPSGGKTRNPSDRDGEPVESAEMAANKPPMAVSIAGISTACSKDALVSSAKAVREALSTD